MIEPGCRAITAGTASRTDTDPPALTRLIADPKFPPPSSSTPGPRRSCDVDLYDGDGAIPREELKRRVADKDALIAVLTDRIDGESWTPARR